MNLKLLCKQIKIHTFVYVKIKSHIVFFLKNKHIYIACNM